MASNDLIKFDVDSRIAAMLEAKGRGPGAKTRLPIEPDLKHMCKQACDVFLAQDPLLELEAPIKVVGDIHGQYHDLLRLFEFGGFPPESNYLFLGDYVDRGKQSLEVITLLIAYKMKFPENFFMLRGNHECAAITRIYGFYDECKRRYSIKVWKIFTDLFNKLPFCATIDDRVFCVHGGLSPAVTSFELIRRIQRPTDVPEAGMVCDFLWADPDIDIAGWAENDRGVSYIFGVDIVTNFLKKHQLDVVVRAHQVVADGFEFFPGRKLITLFSAPNYCGEFDNAAAMLEISHQLIASFKVLKPVVKNGVK